MKLFSKPKNSHNKTEIELPKDYNFLNQSIQEFLPFEEIKDMMIRLPGDLYRAVIEVKSINYYLKTTSEQETIEAQFKAAISSWDFPFAFYTQTRTIDADDIIARLSEDVTKLTTKELRSYGREYVEAMGRLTKSKNGNLVKKNYIVISCNDASLIETNITQEDKSSYAFDKLSLNCRKVSDSLAPIGMVCNVLTNEELIELLLVAINKHNILKAEDIIEHTSNITTGQSEWDTSKVDILLEGLLNELNNMMLRNHDLSSAEIAKAQEIIKKIEDWKKDTASAGDDLFVL